MILIKKRQNDYLCADNQSIISMNRIPLIILSVFMATMLASASEKVYPKAALIATYRYEYNTIDPHKNKPSHRHDDFVLLAGQRQSTFYGVRTRYIDSIYADPQSRSEFLSLRVKLREALGKPLVTDGKIHYVGDKELGLPVKGLGIVVGKDFDAGILDIMDDWSATKYTYTLAADPIDWELTDTMATVSGYECAGASCIYHGREWNVWFCPDVPIQDGPWQLYGLPGLIIKAESADGDHCFSLTGLEESSREILPPPMPIGKVVVAIDRKEYLRMRHEYMLNPVRSLKKRGFAVLNKEEADNDVVHDFLETDYKE